MNAIPQRHDHRGTGVMALTAGLMAVGVMMILSASATAGRPLIDTAFWKTQWFRQALFAGLALAVMASVANLPYVWWRWRDAQHRPVLYLLFITVFALGLVFVPGVGVERNGARRWVEIPGLVAYGGSFQPSELAKLTVILLTSALMARPLEIVRSFRRGFLPPVAALGLCVALVGIEDFGTAALLAVVGGAIIAVGGAKWWHMLIAALPGLAGFAYLLISTPYRMTRLTSFLDIWADPDGDGYHAIQSLCTIASGNWWGKGLGEGIQKYGYLPEARTDFVFAVICEEMGVLGGVGVIALYVMLLTLGALAIWRAADSQGRLLALGVTLLIGVQAAMNVAVVTVSVPTKGIALPFVSAGGSGLIFLAIAVGLLVSVSRRVRPPDPQLADHA
jgi:cell division protein FtsW